MYEIDSRIASGGMGEVYRARDPRLGRSVALKVLPAEIAESREAVARFEREARAASALNHPHILHVYDVGTAQVGAAPIHYIAMELVDGETLRSKLERHTPLKELLEPLIDVAEALEKAHAAGIIHRDLKPENIMVTRDGYAKVLDFGLAKLLADFGPHVVVGDEATARHARTGTGVVVGTIGYMSPEQVEGRPLDGRSDIFSFGCILYEAISGARAFQGPSTIDTMHKIVHDDPPTLTTPPELQRIVRKCLGKDPDQRYQHIKEVAVDLREIRRASENGATQRPPKHSTRVWIYVALTAVLVGTVISRLPRPEAVAPLAPPQPFSSIDIERVTFTGDVASAAISRTGKYLAYTRVAGNTRSLWLKQFTTGADVQLVRPGELRIGDVAFSPDEDYVYFVVGERNVGRNVYRIPTVGGSAQEIVPGVASSISFAPDGRRFAYVRRTAENRSHLATADLDGGNEQIVYSGKESIVSPAWSPRGNEMICLSFRENHHPVSLSVIDLRQHKLSVLRETRGVHVWMPDGNALISPKVFPEPTQQLRYVPYPRGKERRITADLSNYVGTSLTGDGRTIASVQLQRSGSIWLLPGGRSSAARQLTPTIAGRNDGAGMTCTPDGTIVYFSVDREIHLKAIRPGEEPRTLWSEPYVGIMLSSPPSISRDGKWIAYSSHPDGALWLMDRDGGNRRRLATGNVSLDPQWQPDGSGIIYTSYTVQGRENPMFSNSGVWRISAAGGVPTVIDPNADSVRLSPDGKRLLARRAGSKNVVLMSVDGSDARELPLPSEQPNRGGKFAWSPDGSAVDYIGDDEQLWRWPVSGGAPRRLTNAPGGLDYWAWSPDGSQLAVARSSESSDVVLIRDRRR